MTGALGVLWCLAWAFFVSDDPSNHKFISTSEKEFILAHRKVPTREIGNKRPPYLKILMTPSVWILAFCDFSSSFGLYVVAITGPTFINKILKMDILAATILSYG